MDKQRTVPLHTVYNGLSPCLSAYSAYCTQQIISPIFHTRQLTQSKFYLLSCRLQHTDDFTSYYSVQYNKFVPSAVYGRIHIILTIGLQYKYALQCPVHCHLLVHYKYVQYICCVHSTVVYNSVHNRHVFICCCCCLREGRLEASISM